VEDFVTQWFSNLPWWLDVLVALVLTAVTVFFGKKLPRWATVVLGILKAAALRSTFSRFRRLNVKVEPLDPTARVPSDGSEAGDADLPPSVAVDSNGTPIDTSVSGRPPENESGSGG
jgi:hypothetical protein